MVLAQKIENYTHEFAKWTGSTAGFAVAFVSVVIWFSIGCVHDFSSRWENALMVYTSVAMFLMLFLMQRSQNKELSALHLKLNELIAATQHADNSLINIEELTERELSAVHDTHRQIIA